MIDRICLRNAAWILVLAAAFVALGVKAPVLPLQEPAEDYSVSEVADAVPGSVASLATH